MRDLNEFARDIIEGAATAGSYGFIGDWEEVQSDLFLIHDRYEEEDQGIPVTHAITTAQITKTLIDIFRADRAVLDSMGVGEDLWTDICKAILDEDEEGQLDVIAYLAIVEILVFGAVIYN